VEEIETLLQNGLGSFVRLAIESFIGKRELLQERAMVSLARFCCGIMSIWRSSRDIDCEPAASQEPRDRKTTMDYIFLIYSDKEHKANVTEAERQSRIEDAKAVWDDAVAKGVFKGASPLEPPETAMTARSEGGKVVLTDGPFVETKEFLAGYWILDCANPEEAKAWASRLCGGTCRNTVEFRALASLPEILRGMQQSGAQMVNA
jgi:hypothetical protein